MSLLNADSAVGIGGTFLHNERMALPLPKGMSIAEMRVVAGYLDHLDLCDERLKAAIARVASQDMVARDGFQGSGFENQI